MSSSSRKRLGEFEAIARLFAPLAYAPGALGLTDDVALLRLPKARELVLTADALVEGVHFLAGDPAGAIARKALRVNLSDLAAKGAEPVGYLMALSLPSRTSSAWLAAFARGLAQDQAAFGISLLGGDTTATPGPLTIAITAIGSIPKGAMIRRSGARAGDLVYVTGAIGDAGAGLELLRRGTNTGALVARYRIPEPRLSLGGKLRRIASAALDVSDGLIADLGHIADTSRVRIVVEAARIPLSTALRRAWGDGLDARIRAATSGDDYEIAFTAPPRLQRAVAAIARQTGVPVTEIGRVGRGRGVALLDADGAPLPIGQGGYTHF